MSSLLLFPLATMSPYESLLSAVTSGVLVHVVYKIWEPLNPFLHVFTFLILPISLSSALSAHYGVVTATLLGFALYYGSLLASIALYRVSPFHPCYRYPGPIGCKLSKLWFMRRASKGTQHRYLQKLHERYGDVVRIGPNEISIRDADVINSLMGSQGLPKGRNWTGRTMHDREVSVIALRDSAEHAQRRKAWNRGFNTASIKEYQPFLTSRAGQLVDTLATQKSVVDLSKWMGYFTYDFMCDIVFGGGSEMIRDGDPEGMWDQMETAMRLAFILENLPWLGYYGGKIRKVAPALFKFRRLAIERITSRSEKGAFRKDVMYHLSNEDIGAEPPSQTRMIGEGILAIVAGSDTTSSVLSNTFYFLLTQPEIYRKLQAEVDKFYPVGADALDPKFYGEMPYLEAVINETLRLLPAVMSGSPREPKAGSGGKLVGQYFVPEGCVARMHFYSIHRDPRNFSDPSKFWPERWLIAEGLLPEPAGFVHNPNAFIPFSHGPANCVGKFLAMHEMRTVICNAVQKLSLSFAPGYDPKNWEEELEDRFIAMHGKLPVVVRARA